uniref:F-box domain-containing protein n=1 Tax=Brugia pahangi TaxID=6280 RepID=A0A0N4T922_BRUPA
LKIFWESFNEKKKAKIAFNHLQLLFFFFFFFKKKKRKKRKHKTKLIFSFLDITSLCRCAQTCRHWNLLALDGSNWQQVDLFQFQKDIKAPVVENLAKRCGGFLKKLSLRGCENVQENALRSFTLKCPNIEHLSLYKCKRVTDSTCEYLGRNCHRLVWLDLENCTAITDKSLR